MAGTPLSTPGARYGERVLQVEPYGVEPIPAAERHGRPWGQFTLWLGSNLTIADYALGFLPVSLGLPWSWALTAILLGNLLGAWALGLCAAMGPAYGRPQLIISRSMFGRAGGYLPGLLNYISTIGWFSVNNILGAFGLRVLWPGLAFWQAALLLVVVQGLIAVFGHNLIHAYERLMSVVLGVLFLGVTGLALAHGRALAAYHPVLKSPWAFFAILVAASFSYLGSWGPYAADYSRYLPADTPRRAILGWSFLEAFLASVWLELVGAAVAVLAGKAASNPLTALHGVMGGFGDAAVVAVILGGTAADALNLYSNALSAGALDIRLPRWTLAAAAGVIGLGLSLLGSGSFETYYSNFLLLLGYWITPWMGVLFADFYLRRRRGDPAAAPRVFWPGLGSFLAGILLSVPFMSSVLYTGPVAAALGGADLTFYVGFLAALVLYLVWTRRTA
ncbi:Allantoin permease [Candidatus Hydrogenisulfobacillus filiaventi]|uniref:Allantoin permease n=1 Tax=Candidatus Hydrogenisulfobacillus filiaventi TaxID=2707344 RepID=A0A6F8ZHV2_9FIRM|nr:Allantoin permease [Candidatus Hydrogenisulfobacillus filiaventi]